MGTKQQKRSHKQVIKALLVKNILNLDHLIFKSNAVYKEIMSCSEIKSIKTKASFRAAIRDQKHSHCLWQKWNHKSSLSGIKSRGKLPLTPRKIDYSQKLFKKIISFVTETHFKTT